MQQAVVLRKIKNQKTLPATDVEEQVTLPATVTQKPMLTGNQFKTDDNRKQI